MVGMAGAREGAAGRGEGEGPWEGRGEGPAAAAAELVKEEVAARLDWAVERGDDLAAKAWREVKALKEA